MDAITVTAIYWIFCCTIDAAGVAEPLGRVAKVIAGVIALLVLFGLGFKVIKG